MSRSGGTSVFAGNAPSTDALLATRKRRAIRLPALRAANKVEVTDLGRIPVPYPADYYEDFNEKRRRFDSGSTVDSQDLNTASDLSSPGSSNCAAALDCLPSCGHKTREKLEPLVHGSVYEDFKIVGAGPEASAVQLSTGEIFLCRVIADAEYATIQKVVQRLQESGKYYKEHDLYHMREMVFPSKTQMVEEVGGRRLLFTPTHYGSLHSFAHRKGHDMSEADVRPIFQQMVRLVAFCHAIGLVVREIKPRRLVFTDREYKNLRLASVQEIVVCDDPEKDSLDDKFGSPAYVPPEVLRSGRTVYAGKPADVWGIGVVLYLLLVGRYPFFDTAPLGVFYKIKRARIHFPPNTYLTRSVRALIYGILRREPSERPTAQELLYTPWPHAPTTAVRPRPRVYEIQNALTLVSQLVAQEAMASLRGADADESDEWPRAREPIVRRSGPVVSSLAIVSGPQTTAPAVRVAQPAAPASSTA